MQEVYLVCVQGGEYKEENWESALVVALDEERAKAAVKQYEREDHRFQENYNKLAQFEGTWEEQDRYPSSADHYQLEFPPRWKAGLHMDEITPEMRAEREAIGARNKVKIDAYQKVCDEWKERKDKAMNEFLISLGVVEGEMYLNALSRCDDRSDRRYVIRKVPLLT